MRNKLILLLGLLIAPALTYAGSFRTGQASITTVTPVLVGSVTDRNSITVYNGDASNPVYCGNSSSVTSSTGLLIKAGVGFTLDDSYNSAYTNSPSARQTFYCVATGGTVTLSYLETVK